MTGPLPHWQHIIVEQPQVLDDIDEILQAVASPEHREGDPRSGVNAVLTAVATGLALFMFAASRHCFE